MIEHWLLILRDLGSIPIGWLYILIAGIFNLAFQTKMIIVGSVFSSCKLVSSLTLLVSHSSEATQISTLVEADLAYVS